ncbi:9972_t:CDS:2, partial [Paraglomus brasilianum]
MQTLQLNQTQLLATEGEVVQVTLLLQRTDEAARHTQEYADNVDLQKEIMSVVVSCILLKLKDQMIIGTGYRLQCTRRLWDLGRRYVFKKRNEQLIPHPYKYMFVLEIIPE